MLEELTRSELAAQLWSKASKDEVFKRSLIDDPNRVLERDFGLQVPQGTTVKILQETAETMYLVLPQWLLSAQAREVPERVREVVREPFAGTESCSCTQASTC
jgi:hypothetical protein